MKNERLADFIAILLLSAMLFVTCFLSHERGLEATSLNDRVTAVERRMDRLRPVPKVEINRGTVYAGTGEIIIETQGVKQ